MKNQETQNQRTAETAERYLKAMEAMYKLPKFNGSKFCIKHGVGGILLLELVDMGILKTWKESRKKFYKWNKATAEPNQNLAENAVKWCSERSKRYQKNREEQEHEVWMNQKEESHSLEDLEKGETPQELMERTCATTEEEAIEILKNSTKYKYEIYRVERTQL